MTEFVTQELNVTLVINGFEYLANDINIKTNDFNESDMVEGKIVPDRHSTKPVEGDDAFVDINGELAFTGYVGDVTDNVDGSYEIKFFNAIHKLKTSRVDINVDELTPASELLENHVFPQAGVEDFSVELIPKNIADVVGHIKPTEPIDNPIVMDRTDAPGDEVLDELTKLTNSMWWVRPNGYVMVSDPDSVVHQMEYIRDNSPGKLTPPYRGVKVVGDDVISAGGWKNRNLVSKQTAVAKRVLEKPLQQSPDAAQVVQNAGVEWAIQEGALKKPVFTYKSKDIKTKAQADAIADKLATKLIHQTKSGYVEVVGRPEIEVLDVIEMPYNLGGEQYMVQGVEHRIDNSEGFRTRIHVGGLIQS